MSERDVDISLRGPLGGLRFEHLASATGVRSLILDPANAGAVFQAASQFNCLEMVGPGVSPHRGVAIYAQDPTQGPKCALACPAGTVYRNYLCQDGAGQGSKQIDCLRDVARILQNEKESLWQMRNGYCLPASSESMGRLGRALEGNDQPQLDAINALRVGVHWRTQAAPPHTHCVTQVYASAV